MKRLTTDKSFSYDKLTMEQLVDSVYSRNISNNGFFIEKADIIISRNGENQKYLFTAKFQKPDKFLVSVRNTSGIEGARIYITNDSVFVNDRINGRLLYGKRNDLERKTGIPADLEKIAFGDLIFNVGQAGKHFEGIDNQGIMIINKNNYKWKIILDPILKKVRTYEISDIIKGSKETFRFDNFSKGNRPIPFIITFEDKERNISAKIKISRIRNPWIGEVEFIPGRGYTKEEFK
jgi:hypothetical protein